MNTKKINRRTFAKYASHSMISAALGRVFFETKAFGSYAQPKLMVCTSPNGHFDWQATKQAVAAGVSQQTLQSQVLFLEQMNNAVTSNGNQGFGDWHAGESALLSFQTGKRAGPSFYTAVPNLRKVYLGVDLGNRVYARDSSGGQVPVHNSPQQAMSTVFGGARYQLTSQQLGLLAADKMHVLDPCLEDIRSLRKQLGADGVLFDDYLYSIQEVYKEARAMAQTSENQSNPPGQAGSSQGNTNNGESSNSGANAICQSNQPIDVGQDQAERHRGMLLVARQILACDMADVVVLSYLHSNSNPQHQYIHGNGSNDGGRRFRTFTNETQTRIAQFADSLTGDGYNLLNDIGIVYISAGGTHFINGRFNSQHPQLNIPCVMFGKMGGAIRASGSLAVGGTNRNLWRSLADIMAGGQANLQRIGGGGVNPVNGLT